MLKKVVFFLTFVFVSIVSARAQQSPIQCGVRPWSSGSFEIFCTAYRTVNVTDIEVNKGRCDGVIDASRFVRQYYRGDRFTLNVSVCRVTEFQIKVDGVWYDWLM